MFRENCHENSDLSADFPDVFNNQNYISLTDLYSGILMNGTTFELANGNSHHFSCLIEKACGLTSEAQQVEQKSRSVK